ncbi:50S ribosomal protein L22 [candidate division KSB1 bacterium]|nr:MAG: 50S ribosomal protein L22 [candidate division KSB1 bacterium]
MIGKAKGKYIRHSPRKVRRVAELIKGKGVEEALNILHFCPKAASRELENVLRSAISNLLNQEGSKKVKVEDFIVSKLEVNQGPTLKRFRPRAMGRATRIRKRSSHINIEVSNEV